MKRVEHEDPEIGEQFIGCNCEDLECEGWKIEEVPIHSILHTELLLDDLSIARKVFIFIYQSILAVKIC